MHVITIVRAWLGFLALACGASVVAQEEADTKIEIVSVAPGLHMLQGPGGNIGVSSGPDRTFMIDDKYAPLTPAIIEAVATFTNNPVTFVLNTHWHEDHTGGNETLGKGGAIIVAHDNVRVRLNSEQFVSFFDARSSPSPAAALPIVTFDETVTFYLNGDEIHVFHVPNAHTDGDAIVHFRKADVIHTGDTFFNGLYPFIDYDSGGSIEGVIAAVDRMLGLAGAQTKIIPGHGPLTDAKSLAAYRTMLDAVRGRVRAAVGEGKSLGEVIAMKPTADYDEAWGKGFIAPDKWVEMIYKGMLTHPARM